MSARVFRDSLFGFSFLVVENGSMNIFWFQFVLTSVWAGFIGATMRSTQLYSRKRLRLVSHVARLLSGLCPGHILAVHSKNPLLLTNISIHSVRSMCVVHTFTHRRAHQPNYPLTLCTLSNYQVFTRLISHAVHVTTRIRCEWKEMYSYSEKALSTHNISTM